MARMATWSSPGAPRRRCNPGSGRCLALRYLRSGGASADPADAPVVLAGRVSRRPAMLQPGHDRTVDHRGIRPASGSTARPLAQVLIGAGRGGDVHRHRRRPQLRRRETRQVPRRFSSTGCATAALGAGSQASACDRSEFQNWAQDWLVTTAARRVQPAARSRSRWKPRRVISSR